MNDKPNKKLPLPRLNSDAEAEKFVAEADLSRYDLSNGKTVRFEFSNAEKDNDKPHNP